MEREYEQTAMMAQAVVNSLLALMAQNARKRTFKPVELEKFLPDFMTKNLRKNTSVEQQRSEWSVFVADAKSKLGIT